MYTSDQHGITIYIPDLICAADAIKQDDAAMGAATHEHTRSLTLLDLHAFLTYVTTHAHMF